MPPCSGANDGQKIWWGQWDGYDYEMECKEVLSTASGRFAGSGPVTESPARAADQEGCVSEHRTLLTLPQTPRVTRTLLAAEEIAQGLDHDFVGTEHVLLALIADRDGIAGRVLAELGASEPVRERIYETVTSSAYSESSTEIFGFDPSQQR
jgi:ATP-dependent Clp protease ATP-binding subunit ClpA